MCMYIHMYICVYISVTENSLVSTWCQTLVFQTASILSLPDLRFPSIPVRQINANESIPTLQMITLHLSLSYSHESFLPEGHSELQVPLVP